MLLFILQLWLLISQANTVSIHHMLLFIATEESENPPEKLFQYITCYSLSQFTRVNYFAQRQFQYITCYSLSRCDRHRHSYNGVSIHHMLLFIHVVTIHDNESVRFQYITCYSLSALLPSPSQFTRGFNTSHVTLYPAGIFILFSIRSFNTSHVTLYRKADGSSDPPGTEFQYITCYSLSR